MKTDADHIPFDLQDRYESESDDEAAPSKFMLKLQQSEHLKDIGFEKWEIEEKLKKNISDAEVKHLKKKLVFLAKDKEHVLKNHERLPPQQWGLMWDKARLREALNAAPVIVANNKPDTEANNKPDLDAEIGTSDDDNELEWGTTSVPAYLRENKACSSAQARPNNFEGEEEFDAGF